LKVCPECDEVYRGEETYCPRDGTKLEARESFEESDRAARLGPVQDLARADDDADEGPRRFKGRLADGTDVIVTVLERAELVDAASHRLPDLLETLTGPLPRSVLSVHSVDLEGTPPYVVEAPARGHSLEAHLGQTDRLDWKSATRIVSRVGRILHWMSNRGALHYGLHPGHIYPRFEDGSVRGLDVGGWVTAAATVPDRPLEASGYAGHANWAPYMAPETIRDGTHDARSAVYTLGMLFYHMVLGKPPFTSRQTEDILRRHLNETPLRLAIAAGADVPIDVDSILERSWSKDPEARIQTPSAFVGALCGQLGEHPDVAAPKLEIDRPYFDTRAPRTPEAGPENPARSPASQTLHGLPGVGKDEEDDDHRTHVQRASSESTSEEMAELNPGPTEPIDLDRVDAGSKTVDVDLPEPAETSGSTRTQTGSGEAAAPSVIIEDPTLQEPARSPDDTSDTRQGEPDAYGFRAPDRLNRRWTTRSPDRVLTAKPGNANHGVTLVQTLSESSGSVTREPHSDNRTPPPAGDDAISLTDVPGDASGDRQGIGFVEVDDADDDIDNDWFSKSAEDAYLEEDVRNEVDRSEILRKYATGIGLALLGLGTVVFLLIIMTY
jgi:serine/threonine-protein kinase